MTKNIYRKTSDIPEHHREEAEMVIPSYGYFIRGAQTTFSGVLRFVHNICPPHPHPSPLNNFCSHEVNPSKIVEILSRITWKKS